MFEKEVVKSPATRTPKVLVQRAEEIFPALKKHMVCAVRLGHNAEQWTNEKALDWAGTCRATVGR